MQLKTIIYTTSRSFWIEKHFEEIYQTIKRTAGVECAPFVVRLLTLPSKVPTYVATSGGVFIDWKWLKANLPAGDKNALCLHITSAERNRLGLKHPTPGASLGGVYNRDSDSVFDFIVIADQRGKSYGGMSAFTRIFLHELSHGFAHWQGVSDLTHTYDYNLKDIKGLFAVHNFNPWKILTLTIKILTLKVQLLMKGVDVNNPPNTFPAEKSNADKLYEVAKSQLGLDASPKDLAPDELGCAETVSNIIAKVIPNFAVVTGTWTLWDKLRTDKRFEYISNPEKGAVVISPTGKGNGTFPGHVGICEDNIVIMSNDSATGMFMRNFNVVNWEIRYKKKGGFPIYYFRLK